MAINYARGLSDYKEKGVCGLPEIKDDEEIIKIKINELANLIKDSKKIVVLCGAGISTSCGVPDFRGPNGVWTKELKNEEVILTSDNLNFKTVKPSFTHLALKKLIDKNIIQLIISQNVDGLFLKVGLKKSKLCELHGNFFLNECTSCSTRFIMNVPSLTMGLKQSTQRCLKKSGRPCRGFLRDTILDWEDELPPFELNKAEEFCKNADLVICLGTSLQIFPVADLPFLCKKRKTNKGKVVIVNLQKTKFDSKADLVIHDKIDDLFKKILLILEIEIKDYNESEDLILTSKPGDIYD